jgi:hypothetical protein
MPLAVRAVLAAAVLVALALPASASAAPPRNFVGLSADDLFGNAGAYRDKALDQQRAARVQVLRVSFSWAAIEVAPNSYDFSIYDRYVVDAARRNITFLPVLFNAPTFRARRPPRGNYVYPPRDNAEMGVWAAMLVDRYGPNGSIWRSNPDVTPRPITAWQIWNEPNLKQYWLPRPNAKQYLGLLRTVGQAIKAKDPNAEIVTAGLPDSLQKSAIRLAPYLKGLYRGGGSSAFDTVAINSYALNAKHLGRIVGRTRKLMNRRGGRSDKTWITEIGWCDGGYKPGHRFCVGKKRQARNISSSIKLMKRKRAAWKLRGFVLFAWRDGRPYTSRDFWGNHAGLLTIRGKKKPAYKAFVRAVRRL